MPRVRRAEERAHADNWLVSYCDMITLLVTFFLMMMTFSTNDRFDVRDVGASILDGGGGIWREAAATRASPVDDVGAAERLGRALTALAVEDGQVLSVRPESDGFSIGFGLDASFAPGSAEASDALRRHLGRLSVVLAGPSRRIVVEGFTDAAFAPSAEFSSADELGLARAASAAEILVASGAVDPCAVQVSSLGSRRPRAPNDSEAGRASNRRVELRVVPHVPALDLARGIEARAW